MFGSHQTQLLPFQQLVGVHLLSEDVLVQTAGIDADSDRFIELASDLDKRSEILIVARATTHVSGVNPVFRQRLGAVGVAPQKPVPNKMEVADQRHVVAEVVEALP